MQPSSPGSRIKCCTASVCLSVCPLPSIYLKSKSRNANFKFEKDTIMDTNNYDLKFEVKVTEYEDVKFSCIASWKGINLCQFKSKTKMILDPFYTYCSIHFTSGSAWLSLCLSNISFINFTRRRMVVTLYTLVNCDVNLSSNGRRSRSLGMKM